MAKPKIEKKDQDLQELIRDYWQSLEEERGKLDRSTKPAPSSRRGGVLK